MRGIEKGDQISAERNANGAADDEWQNSPPLQGIANFPYPIALIDHPVCGDQHRGLQRRNDLQPEAGHNEPSREAGQAAGETAEKCSEEKKSKTRAVHV